ncbi:MAG: hypothetical protein LBU70_07665 [Chitinispirillales bacterium]|nr:hypothetical protein [Chitinispirillales bacterium]
MTTKQRKLVKICSIILAISLAVMVVSTVIQIINSGWESFNMVNIVPFLGVAVVMIAILASDKKKDDK